MTAQSIADAIRAELPNVKSGTLRFWGDWFGRPMDNLHILRTCKSLGASVILQFDQNEVLTIWDPTEAAVDKNTFVIKNASRVRWEWHLYGSPQEPSNRAFLQYERTDNGISVESNVPQYQREPNERFPAVEVL